MKDDFREGQTTGRDPLDARQQDFDWPSLFAAFGEPDPTAEECDRAAQAVRVLLQSLFAARWRTQGGDALLGRKLIGLAWTIDPALTGGDGLAAIARDIGKNKESLSCHAAEARRNFRLRTRAAAKGWNWRPATPETDATTETKEHDEP